MKINKNNLKVNLKLFKNLFKFNNNYLKLNLKLIKNLIKFKKIIKKII